MVVLILRLLMLTVTLQPPAQEKPLTPKQEAAILQMLGGDDTFLEAEFAQLGGFSSAAFPLYCRILDAKDEDRYLVVRTLYVLSQIKEDRSQFVDRALSRLAHSHPSVRRTAVELLAQIGSSRDAAPVVALLSDKEWTISFAAAKTLATIGDQRTLIAMDVWLNTNVYKDDEQLREHIIKCRDELKARLDKEKQQKEKPPGK